MARGHRGGDAVFLDAGDREQFDRWMEEGLRQATPAERQTYQWRAKPYGLASPFDVFTAARKYNLADVAHKITTPMLIIDPEGEQFWRSVGALRDEEWCVEA